MGAPGLGTLGALYAPPPPDAVSMPVGAGALPAQAFTTRTVVRNQGARNSCTGHAFGAAMNILSGGALISSPLALYYDFRKASGFAPSQDAGAFMEPAAKALCSLGVGSEALWPYDPAKYAVAPPTAYRQQAADHRCAGWYRALSVASAKTALSLGLPVVLAFEVPPDFGGVGATGAWQDNGGAAIGGHAVLMVGYDDTARATGAFLVLNSWGDDWGTMHPSDTTGPLLLKPEGHFWLPYSSFPGSRFFDAIAFSAVDTVAGG